MGNEIALTKRLNEIRRLEIINAKLLTALKEAPVPIWRSPLNLFEERYHEWYGIDRTDAIDKAEQ